MNLNNLNKMLKKNFFLSLAGSSLPVALLSIIFWPGIITDDGFGMLLQVLNFIPYDDTHPVLNTLLYKIFTFEELKLAGAILSQHLPCILITSSISYTTLQRQGREISAVWYFLIPFLIVITPPIGLFQQYLNKNITWGWFFVLLIFSSFFWLEDIKKGKTKLINLNSFLFFLSGFFIISLRHNGYLSYLFIMIPMVLIYSFKASEKKKSFYFANLSFFLLFMLISKLLPITIGAQTEYWKKYNIKDQIIVHDYISSFLFGYDKTPKRKQTIKKYTNSFSIKYNPANSAYFRSLIFHPPSEENRLAFQKHALNYLKKNPFIWIKTKWTYVKKLVSMEGSGYILPNIQNSENPLILKFGDKIDLEMRPSLAPLRKSLYFLYGMGVESVTTERLKLTNRWFWNFKKIFYLIGLAYLFYILKVAKKYFSTSSLSLLFSHAFFSELTLPIWGLVSVWGLWGIISGYNDFQYFWFTFPLAYFLFLILFFKFKNAS